MMMRVVHASPVRPLDTLLGRATPGAYERFVAMLRAVEVPAPKAGSEEPADQTGRLKRLINPPAKFVPALPPPVRKLTMAPNGLLGKPPAELWDDPRLADALEHRVARRAPPRRGRCTETPWDGRSLGPGGGFAVLASGESSESFRRGARSTRLEA
jgi:hypothetical protein